MVTTSTLLTEHRKADGALPRYVHHTEFDQPDCPRRYLHRIKESLEMRLPLPRSVESRLFVAMHWCARQAHAHRGIHTIVTVKAEHWLRRHQLIRDHLTALNIGLVFGLLRRRRITNVDEDELLSAGLRALFDAVEAFDPWRGNRFSTYACNAIFRAFLRESKLETRRSRHVVPGLDHHLDVIGDDDVSSHWDEWVYSERLNDTLEHNGADLSEVECFVLNQRFPQDAEAKRATLKRLGQELSLSKQRVRDIQCTALRKLHQAVTATPVLA